MYFGGSVIGKALTIGIISSTPPLIFTVIQKVQNLASFSTSLNFEPLAFENAARYMYLICVANRFHYSSTCHLLHTVTIILENTPFVVVLAVDFSKAFDNVRHSAVLKKFSYLDLPDHIYNWTESFFRDRFHCTRPVGQQSKPRAITTNIVQGSAAVTLKRGHARTISD